MLVALVNWSRFFPLLHLRSSRPFGRRRRGPWTKRDATAPTSSSPFARHRSDPLPSPANLSATPFSLTCSYIAVLLHHRADSLPDPLPFRERMHRPQNVVSQIRQKDPRVINILIPQFLLVCKPCHDGVHQSWNLRRSDDMPLIAGACVKRHAYD